MKKINKRLITNVQITNALEATKQEYLNSGKDRALDTYREFITRHPDMKVVQRYLYSHLPDEKPQTNTVETIDRIISNAMLDLTTHNMHKKMVKNLDKSLFKGKDLGLVNSVINYLKKHELDIDFDFIKTYKGTKFIQLSIPYNHKTNEHKLLAMRGLKDPSSISNCEISLLPQEYGFPDSLEFCNEYSFKNKDPNQSKTILHLFFHSVDMHGFIKYSK